MCYKNFRVARKILKRRKNKLFGVTSRFQFLQSEKTEEISIIQINFSASVNGRTMGHQRKLTGNTEEDHILNLSLS